MNDSNIFNIMIEKDSPFLHCVSISRDEDLSMDVRLPGKKEKLSAIVNFSYSLLFKARVMRDNH